MEHVLVLLYVLAFATSAAAMSLAYYLSTDGRHPFFRDYFLYLALLNVGVLANMVMTYLQTVGGRDAPAEGTGLLAALMRVAATVLVGGFVYWQVRAMYATVCRQPPSAALRVVPGLLILGAVSASILAFIAPSGFPGAFDIVPRTVNLGLIAAAAAANSHVFMISLASQGGRPGVVRLFCGFHVAAYLALLAGFLLPTEVAWHLLATVFLVLNLVPLLLLRRLRPHLALRSKATEMTDGRLRAFADAHGISSRETEIVAQVLTGGTTAEIAERLFISASTVKKHIHSVYRKCGVRNRVELTLLVNQGGNEFS